jgi:8-oxo-dGTP diphosphatase
MDDSIQTIQEVVVGVIHNLVGEILITRRLNHVAQGGLWEFPGGKCEIGEPVEAALKRELKEELGIIVQQARPLIRITHAYPEQTVRLDVWQVEQLHGKESGREGQEIQWCTPKDLHHYRFPVANSPIITAIQLPSLYLITPEPPSAQDKQFFYHLEAGLDKGIALVQLRARELSEYDFCHCAEQALTVCSRYAAQLLVNATPEIALSVGAHGVHLSSERLLNCVQRPLSYDLWVAASCHSLEEILQTNLIGVDFIVLSPVRTSISHPTTPPLRWLEFFQLTEQADCPVYALGGMKVEDTLMAWSHGAQGIAAIRGLWEET